MRVERHQVYPVSARTLVDVLTHQDFFRWRLGARGEDDFHFDAFEQTSEGMLIRVHRELQIKSDRVPAVARRFVGRGATLVTEFLWTETQTQPYQARYLFKLGSVPVEVKGQVRLLDEQGSAHQHIVVEVTSNVPLIGRKLVEMVGERVEKALDSDYRGTLRYLEKQGLVGDTSSEA